MQRCLHCAPACQCNLFGRDAIWLALTGLARVSAWFHAQGNKLCSISLTSPQTPLIVSLQKLLEEEERSGHTLKQQLMDLKQQLMDLRQQLLTSSASQVAAAVTGAVHGPVHSRLVVSSMLAVKHILQHGQLLPSLSRSVLIRMT